MFFLRILLFTFLLTCLQLYACELEKPKAAPKSLLCQFYGINEKLCELPQDVQNLIVERLANRYPEAFSHITIAKPLRVIKKHTRMVTSLLLFDQGTKLISGSWDGLICIWGSASGALVREINVKNFLPPRDQGPSDCEIEHLALSEDESRLAVSVTSRLLIFDMHTFEVFKNVFLGYRPLSMQFLDKGKKLMTAPPPNQTWPSVRIWIIENCSKLSALQVYKDFLYRNKSGFSTLSPNEKNIVIYNGDKMALFDIDDPKKIIIEHEAPGCIGNGQRIFLTPSRILFGLANSVGLWDLEANKIVAYFKNADFHMTHFEDISKVVESSRREADMIPNIPPHGIGPRYHVGSLSVAPAMQRFMTFLTQGVAEVWDVTSGKKLITYKDFESPEQWFLRQDARSCLMNSELGLAFTGNGRFSDDEGNTDQSLIKFWKMPEIPNSFIRGHMSIKKALFVIFLHDLVRIKTKNGLPQCSIRDIKLPEKLRSELAEIFQTFKTPEKAYIKMKFFT